MLRKNARCRGKIENQAHSILVLEDESEREIFACTKCRCLYFGDGKPVLSGKGYDIALDPENKPTILIGSHSAHVETG
jgi:hypothetical protein